MGSSTETILRTAIDRKACLGSLYDGCRDQILETLNMSNAKISVIQSQIALCAIQKYRTDKSPNLAELIGIEDELRLSLLLNFVPNAGISGIMNYPNVIDQYTRCFRYHYSDRIEYLIKDPDQIAQWTEQALSSSYATHIVSGITVGSGVVILLQLPSDTDLARNIDSVLERVRESLQNGGETLVLTSDDERLCDQILSTVVYSNISPLTEVKNFVHVYRHICRLKNDSTKCQPLKCHLSPMKHFFPKCNPDSTRNLPLEPAFRNIIEHDLLHSWLVIRQTSSKLNSHCKSLLKQTLPWLLMDAHRLYSQARVSHERVVEQLQPIIISIRNCQDTITDMGDVFRDEPYIVWRKQIDDLSTCIDHLQGKVHMIDELQQLKFNYLNAVDCGIQDGDTDTNIEQKLTRYEPIRHFLCSNDELRSTNPSHWDHFRDQMICEHQNEEQSRPMYVDFSYCTYKLKESRIFSLPPKPLPRPRILSITNPQRSSTTSDVINILLLGESGVGKSTFINALVNYLNFESLNQALINIPIVLIPVSFHLRINGMLDDYPVKFHLIEASDIEDPDAFNVPVTQRCKSYLLHLNDSHENHTKLRIIDTPGFGDNHATNMNYILGYLNHLTHVNAVCFLLNSNTSQLSASLQPCLKQILDFLGEKVRSNVLFLFTHTQSTGFTPGDKENKLRSALESFPNEKISLNKENMFCFDSESFRYMVAIQNLIEFNNDQTHDYETSWHHSKNESTQFLEYVRKSLKPYHRDDEWRSTRHAQIEIQSLIRPVLEATRNILRTLALWSMESTKVFIELNPTALSHSSTVCLVCRRKPDRFGNIWIITENVHAIYNECTMCSCPIEKHVRIDYELRHKLLQQPPTLSRSDMIHLLKQLCTGSASFTCFLMNITQGRQNDPFINGLQQMIEEEAAICRTQNPNYLNEFVLNELNKLKTNYENQLREMRPNPATTSLATIYEWILNVKKYPMVAEQVAVITEARQMIIKQHEYEVPNYSKVMVKHVNNIM